MSDTALLCVNTVILLFLLALVLWMHKSNRDK